MARIEKSIGLSRDAGEVWAYVSYYANDVAWRGGVIEVSPTPPGIARPGTRTHEILKFMGATYVTDSEITEVRGRYLRYEGSNASGTVAGYRRVEEVPGGSRFVDGIEIRLRGAVRLLERPLRMLFARTRERDLRKPKSILESG